MHFRVEREKDGAATWWRGRSAKIAGAVAVALIIFSLGVDVGQGRISFGPHSANSGLPAQLDYSSVTQVYNALKANYNGKLTAQQLLDGLKHGLAQATNDPYTEYLTASEAKALTNQLDNSITGIGAELNQDSDKNIVVIAPIAGFPAATAGLKAGDIITTINGQSTTGMSVDDAVAKIRGKAGSKVTLGVVRDKSQTLTFTITRATIQVPSVTSKVLPGNIGYLQISIFSDDTGKLAAAAAQNFKKAGVKGVILDLRGNPGGYLNAAVDVSSLWLPEGDTVVTEKGTIGTDTSYASGADVLHGLPTVVLIDGGSASASEITTGALHDNHAAYVIGEKSYGKGVVQSVVCITGHPDAQGNCPADELKVTVAQWFRPNGQNIQHKGITPDQTVKEPDNATPDNDPQLQAAENYLSK